MEKSAMVSHAVKVCFNGETRRLPAGTVPTHNFGEFVAAILFLFPGAKGASSPTISYVDVDDDVITIRSNEELREAHTSHKGGVAKFTLSFPSAPQSSVGTDSIVGINKDKGVDAVTPTNEASTSAATATTTTASGPPNRLSGCKCKKGKGKATTCTAAKEANNRAIRLLAEGELRAGCEMLQEALVDHAGHKLLLYNLACAHSRMGNTQAACATLDESISAGFNKFKLAFLEQDFENMRNEPAFCKLLLRLAKKKYVKGKRHGFSAFLAPKIMKFRTRVDLSGFISECMRDPMVDLSSLPFLYQSACVFAASGNKAGSLELMDDIRQRVVEKQTKGLSFKHDAIPSAKKILREPALASLREEREMKAMVALATQPKRRSRLSDISSLSGSESEMDSLEDYVPTPSAPPTPCTWSWNVVQDSEEEGEPLVDPIPSAPTAEMAEPVAEPQREEEDLIDLNIRTIQEIGFEADPAVIRCLLEEHKDVSKVVSFLMGDE